MTAPPNQPDSCDLTVYMACFNEEANIVNSLNMVVASVAEVGITYDIILVDDGSHDRSVEIIQRFMVEHPDVPITLVINQANQGIGHNFDEPALMGRGKYYRMICGDDVETQENFVKILHQLGKADIILSYPTDTRVRSLRRRIVSKSYTTLINILSGHKIRYYNNLPVFLRSQATRWHPNSYGFGFQADIVTRLLDMGATFIEVPTVAKERTTGKTKAFKIRNVCSVGHTIIEIIARRISRTLYPRQGRDIHSGHRIVKTQDILSGQQTSTAQRPIADPPATEHSSSPTSRLAAETG